MILKIERINDTVSGKVILDAGNDIYVHLSCRSDPKPGPVSLRVDLVWDLNQSMDRPIRNGYTPIRSFPLFENSLPEESELVYSNPGSVLCQHRLQGHCYYSKITVTKPLAQEIAIKRRLLRLRYLVIFGYIGSYLYSEPIEFVMPLPEKSTRKRIGPCESFGSNDANETYVVHNETNERENGRTKRAKSCAEEVVSSESEISGKLKLSQISRTDDINQPYHTVTNSEKKDLDELLSDVLAVWEQCPMRRRDQVCKNVAKRLLLPDFIRTLRNVLLEIDFEDWLRWFDPFPSGPVTSEPEPTWVDLPKDSTDLLSFCDRSDPEPTWVDLPKASTDLLSFCDVPTDFLTFDTIKSSISEPVLISKDSCVK